MSRLAWVLAGGAIASASCSTPERAIDPFPIRVDLSAGAVVTGAADSDEGEPVPVVVDTLSPVTVLDSFLPGDEPSPPFQRRVELTLFGLNDVREPVPRVRFPNTAAFDLHPCAETSADDVCRVGLDDTATPIAGIIGSDVLGRSAVRFDFPDETIRFFPDVAGTDASRSDACEAVFDGPLAGGGTLIIAGSEVVYPGHRPTFGVCYAPPRDELPNGRSDQYYGVNGLMVLSTGLSISVLAESAYDRYAAATGAPPRSELLGAELFLSSGSQTVKIGEISHLALTGDASQDRGPCRELFASRVMSEDLCNEPAAGILQCPCSDNASFCRTPAAIELRAPIRVAIVPDASSLLQALRAELRPEFPELDGILWAEAMAALRLELDYPNSRINMRCLDTTSCITRPQVRTKDSVERLAECVAAAGS